MACLRVLGFCETEKKWAKYALPSIDHEIPSFVSNWTPCKIKNYETIIHKRETY